MNFPIKTKTRLNYFLFAVFLMVFIFMFLNLGNRVLWGDEVEVALLAKNVLKYGYPNGFDGKYLVCSECGDETDTILYKDNYAWRWHPWLMHYLTASSFLLFGISEFTARLPFVIFGLFSLVLLYFFTLKLTNDKEHAILSTTLLAFFVPLYLYSRQTRYYSLVIFFSLAVLISYLKIIRNEKNGIRWFILSSVLLFYSNYIPFFSVYFAVVLHSLIFYFNKKVIKKIIISSIFIAGLTMPWFLYAGIGSKASEFDIAHSLFGMVHVSSYILFYIFPAVFLFFLPSILFFRNKNKKIKLNKNYWLLVYVIISFILLVNFAPYDLPAFRFITFIFPLFAILNARVILNIKKVNTYVAISVLLMMIFTNYLLVVPFKLFEGPALNKIEKDSAEYLFIKDNLRLRYFLFDYLYEITHDYNGPNEMIMRFLRKNSNENEKFLTNSDEMTIVFYTGMLPANESGRPPDWIIPRKPPFLWNRQNNYDFVISKVDKRYEKIIINSTDYIYPLDTPHPRVHRFKENKEMKTSNVYLYETYPIEIYHLKSN